MESNNTKGVVGQPSDFYRSIGIKFSGKWYSHPATNTYDNMQQVIDELAYLIKYPPIPAIPSHELDAMPPATPSKEVERGEGDIAETIDLIWDEYASNGTQQDPVDEESEPEILYHMDKEDFTKALKFYVEEYRQSKTT